MKKILCTLLTIAMLFSMVAIPVMATTPESTVIGYDPAISTAARTANAANVAAATEITADTVFDANVTYYKISTAEGLAQFAVLMRTNTFEGKTVYLTADIDMLGVAYDPTPETVAGSQTASPYFAGTFDGQGYVVSNLHVVGNKLSFSTYYIAGFFERLVGATVKNLVLNTNCVIESGHRAGTQWVGGIAGFVGGATTFSNIYQGASVSGMQKVGGFFGIYDSANTGSNIVFENCTNAGAVAAGYGSAAGFIGHIKNQVFFTNCRNLGSVVNYNLNAGDGIGGFIGRTNGGDGTPAATLENCINQGAVQTLSTAQAGGFVGTFRNTPDRVDMTECYNYGTIYSKQGQIGSLFPTTSTYAGNVVTCNVDNKGADTAVAGTNIVLDAGNTITVDATAPAYSYTPATVGYFASLVVEKDLAGMKNILNYSAEAADTAYVVDTPAGLVKLAEIVNGGDKLTGKTVYLGADINMANIADFAPIGNTTATPFGGIFDGQGHQIDNLTVEGSGDHIGLFGVINAATVKNLVVGAGCTFTSGANDGNKLVGTIATLHGISTVSNVYSAATVNVTLEMQIGAGGIVGGNYDSYNQSANNQSNQIIANCTFNGTVNGGYLAGGILGQMDTRGQQVVLNTVYVLNCHSNATTTIASGPSTWSSGLCTQGGIVGLMNNYGQLVINNAIVNENIGAGKTSGSVVGSVNGTTPMIPIVNATVYNQTKGVIGNGTGNVAVSNYTVSTAEAPTVTTPASAFPAAMVHGYQKSTSTYTNNEKTCISVRVVGSIDSKNYSEVGFKIRVLSTKNTATPQDLGTYETTAVYTSLQAQNATGIGTVTVSAIRDSESAFYAVTIQNLSTTLGEIVLEVIPYAIALDGETEIEGTAGIYTIDCASAANVGDSNVSQG